MTARVRQQSRRGPKRLTQPFQPRIQERRRTRCADHHLDHSPASSSSNPACLSPPRPGKTWAIETSPAQHTSDDAELPAGDIDVRPIRSVRSTAPSGGDQRPAEPNLDRAAISLQAAERYSRWASHNLVITACANWTSGFDPMSLRTSRRKLSAPFRTHKSSKTRLPLT